MRTFDPDKYEPDIDSDFDARPENVGSFREQLRRDYEGLPFEKVLPGEVVENDYGGCYRLTAKARGALQRGDAEQTRQSLLGSVSLVRGIRDKTRVRLEKQGFKTLADLEDHPRFCGESKRIRELLEAGSTEELAEVIGTRLSRSHPSVLGLSGLHDDSDFLFLDLETMGLFAGQPLVVAGLARLAPDNTIVVEQYVVRDFPDELALLKEVTQQVAGHKVMVTYNGKSFDLPFLTGRSAYYGIRLKPPKVHFDLLHFCRRAWGRKRGLSRASSRSEGLSPLSSMSLRSIEEAILGLSRETDLPGELVPEFYYEYLRTGNAGFLKPIVDHNLQDVISLVNVFSSLVEHWSTQNK
ncbi:ribonuclease H-like domain-containing protein [candidate division WOR-3 bacterium]|nr:ribonuclease H-like domain-containing protein [candidate division WOR-3 bacterium]